MNAENVAQLLAATVAPERELAQKAEQQLEEMQKVFYESGTWYLSPKNSILTQSSDNLGVKNFNFKS